MGLRFCRTLLLLAGLCLGSLSAFAAKPLVTMTLVGQGGSALSASFINPPGSGSLIGGPYGGAGWVDTSLTTGTATGGALGVPVSSQVSTWSQSLAIGLGARIGVRTVSPGPQIMGGSCTVVDSLGQPALGSAVFDLSINSFLLDSNATAADRVVNCTVTVGKQATMAWNITLVPYDSVGYVFRMDAGPSSPNGLTGGGGIVTNSYFTSPVTPLTKLYTDTQMGGYNGRGSYGPVSGDYVGGSFGPSWYITDLVCLDSAAKFSGNSTDSWRLPFTWPQANFTVPASYIKPGAQIFCQMIYGKAGLALSKSNPLQLVPGVAASYTLGVAAPTTFVMDPVLNVVDQLAPNIEFVSARPVAGGGLSAVSCTPSGDVASGLLLTCQITRQPPLPANNTMIFEIIVRPTAAALGQSVRNVAVTSPTGSGAALSPASCTANGAPQGCAVTTALTVGGRSLSLTLQGNQPGTYTFSGNNGWAPQALTISTAGTPVTGEPQALTASASTTLNLSSSVSGQVITAATCTGLGGGSVSFSATSLSLDAKATALGNAVSCKVTLGGALLNLSKSNPASLQVGASGSYNLVLSNKGTAATSTPYVVVFDQLPPNVQYTGMTVFTPPGGLTLTASSSCSASGTVAAGQLVTCNLYPPAGGIPANGGQVGIKLNVTPQAPAPSSINKAAVDASGANAVQTPASCTADGVPMAGCAVAPALSIGSLKPFVSFSVVGQGGNGLSASFNNPAGSGSATGGSSGGAGWVNANVTTGATSGGALGTPAQSLGSTPAQALNTGLGARIVVSTTSLVQGGSCTITDTQGNPATGAATFNAADRSFSFDSAATGADRLINCTLTLAQRSTLSWYAAYKSPPGPPSTSTGANWSGTWMIPGSANANGYGTATTGNMNGQALTKTGDPWQSAASIDVVLANVYTLTQVAVNARSKPYPNSEANYMGYTGVYSCTDLNAPNSGNPSVLPASAITQLGLYPNPGSATPNVEFQIAPAYIAPGARLLCSVLYTNASGLLLNKSNPASMTANQTASYALSVVNLNTTASASSIKVYDQLPPNLAYVGAAPVGGGSVTPTAVSCSASGSVDTGQLLTCTVTLSAGLAATGGNANFRIDVKPTPAAAGQSLINKAMVDPTGANAVQNPASCTANAVPAGCAVTPALTVQGPLLMLQLQLNSSVPGTVTFTGNNGWASQSLSVITAGTPVTGTAQALAQTGVATRLTLASPAGWLLTSVSCLDQNAANSGNPASVINPSISGGNSFELPASVLRAGASLVCSVNNTLGDYSLSGQVILDNGVGTGGVAHDGVQNGSETGHAGVLVQLTDCAKVVYASATTDGGGMFALSTSAAPAGPVCLTQTQPAGFASVSYQLGNTAGSYNPATQTLRFTLAANTHYIGVLFGEVPMGQLLGEGSQQLVSGQSVFYAHHYVAGTSASVVFSSSDQPSSSTDRWSSLIYSDSNCNGRLDSGEVGLTGAVSVQAGQQLCLLLKVNSPAGLGASARNLSTLQALETYQPAPVWGAVVNRLSRVDVSTIGSAQGGTLSLFKQVRRVESCPSTAADTQAFATSNQAQPGQYVEYQVVYSNNSAGPLTAIRLSDSVPAYTQYRSAACGPLPAGLQSCTLVQQPAVGATGSLLWELADAPATAAAVGLQPGASGAVVFCVQIQR